MDGMLNFGIDGIGCWVGDNGVMVLSYEDPDCKAAAAEILRRHGEMRVKLVGNECSR